MKIVRKMDRYVAGYFLSSYLICFFFFLGLFLVIDLVGRVDNILKTAPLVAEQGRSLFWLTVELYCYKVPQIFLMVSPYLTVMAAMFCVSRLRKNNELIPMIMSGVSLFRVLSPVFVMAGIFLLGMVASQEYLAPWCAKQRLIQEAFLFHQEERLLIEKEHFRDALGRDIVVRDYNVATEVIGAADISYLLQEQGRQINVSVTAKNLRWVPERGAWFLEEGVETRKSINESGGEPEVRPIKYFATDLIPDDIVMREKELSDMSFVEIRRAYAMNPLDNTMKILLHYHITFPLSNLILLLLGLPFVLRPETRSNLLGVSSALLICGCYFALDVIMRDLGSKDQIHPILATWFSTIFCGAVGVYLFDNIRS